MQEMIKGNQFIVEIKGKITFQVPDAFVQVDNGINRDEKYAIARIKDKICAHAWDELEVTMIERRDACDLVVDNDLKSKLQELRKQQELVQDG